MKDLQAATVARNHELDILYYLEDLIRRQIIEVNTYLLTLVKIFHSISTPLSSRLLLSQARPYLSSFDGDRVSIDGEFFFQLSAST
jgi:hypothetical protein|tara:strand:+ start:184 stop:441 length:258 start_codon:yes stop_codon:yes gene_type:complete